MAEAGAKAAKVWRGASALRRFLVPLDELEPTPGNPRRGDVLAVRESLRHFGQVRPILVDAADGGRRVVAGHHVALAAAEEGWTHVAALGAEFGEGDARRYLLADNRTHDRGDYELESLLAQLAELAETPDGLAGTGYDPEDLSLYLRQEEALRQAGLPPSEFPPLDPDGLATEHRCPSCGYEWSGNPRPGGE